MTLLLRDNKLVGSVIEPVDHAAAQTMSTRPCRYHISKIHFKKTISYNVNSETLYSKISDSHLTQNKIRCLRLATTARLGINCRRTQNFQNSHTSSHHNYLTKPFSALKYSTITDLNFSVAQQASVEQINCAHLSTTRKFPQTRFKNNLNHLILQC
jgi:hypothetical protein